MISYWFRRVSIIGLILLTPLSAKGQSYVVTGLVTDSTAGTPLSSATVALLAQTDSSFVHFTTTRSDGVFSFPRVESARYILQVTFVGMQTAYHGFVVEGQDVDLGNVRLAPSTQDLEEFVVTADRLPFVVRGDTIEYHAMAFVIRPMDMVEDLLRRLPGIEVDPSGNISAQGRTVENVLVEDKEFFGSDPTIATRNLPAESVDRVQVYDKASDRTELTGVPDGRDERTINLELTEEAKKGAFGQTVGGFGGESLRQERYFGRASMFRFRPGGQLALLGGAENVNQPGFSGPATSSFNNPVALTMLDLGGTDGSRRSAAGGVNMTRTLGSNSDINASYFLVNGHSSVVEESERRQPLGDGESVLSSMSEDVLNGTLSHDLVLNADLHFAEGHKMVVRGNLSNTHLTSDLQGIERIFSMDGMDQTTAQSTVHDQTGTMSVFGRAIWSKRISESGRSLVFNTTLSVRKENEVRDLLAESDILRSGDLRTFEESHQLRDLDSHILRNSQRIELIQPLRSGRTITAYLERSNSVRNNNHTRSNRQGEQWEEDLGYSSAFEQNRSYLRPGISFNMSGSNQTWSVTGDMELQHSWQVGRVSYEEWPIRNVFTHLLPNLWGRWEMNDHGELNLFYETETQAPSVLQVQPFEDRRDPLRIVTGNPALTPEYWHNMNANYRLYRGSSGRSFNSDAGVTYTHNSIVRAWTIEEGGRQSITYINSSPTWTANAGILLGKRIRFLGLGWNASFRANVDSGSEFVNGIDNERRLLRMRASFNLDYFVGRAIEAEVNTTVTWNDVQYSHNDVLDRRYMNVRINSGLNWRVRTHWDVASSLEYRTYDRRVFAGQTDIVDLNVSVSRLILDGRSQVELALHDVLNQNQIVRFANSAAYLETSQLDTLGRYVMLKIAYKPRTL